MRDAYADSRTVSVYRKENGGKASALNFGLARARYEIVIALDADTIFAADTMAELVQPLADPQVGAVAGNAKVGNRVNLVTRWQALEYVTSQNLDRRAFSLLNGITVVPGAVGAWRKSLVEAVGGFRSRHAGRGPGPDAGHPARRALDRVRRRRDWLYRSAGHVSRARQAAVPLVLRYAAMRVEIPVTLFRPRYGSLGWAALPNTWLFQLLLPAISPLADLAFVYSLLSIVLTRSEHGNTYRHGEHGARVHLLRDVSTRGLARGRASRFSWSRARTSRSRGSS